MKKKINSNLKGKVGEREWARFCREHGFAVIRTEQYCGKYDPNAADCTGLPYVHQEVKRVEKLNIEKAMQQSVEEAGEKPLMPIVAHRKNHEKWLVTMYAGDWFTLYKYFLKYKED